MGVDCNSRDGSIDHSSDIRPRLPTSRSPSTARYRPSRRGVAVRDEEGRAHNLLTVRLDAPLRLDGVLDEPLDQKILSISYFIQVEPAAGSPATEKTDVWIAFDADNVYVSCRCWETAPERRVAKPKCGATAGLPGRGTRSSRCSLSIPSTTGATAWASTINSVGGRDRRADHQRSAVCRAGLESNLGFRHPAGSTAGGP